jgi:hypothetical protein
MWGGWLTTLLHYPFDVPPQPPGGVLPAHVTDGRQGLTIVRPGYEGRDDVVLGTYARTTHLGGHKQDDAGSIRLMALGRDWIMGGGQARPAAEYQSVALPAAGREGNGFQCGALVWDEETDGGAIIGIDLRRPSGRYHERYVALDATGRWGPPAVLAVLDNIDDHDPVPFTWNLTTAPQTQAHVHADGLGFTLADPAGEATMAARFLAGEPGRIEIGQVPVSKRTYQSGGTFEYAARPLVRAHFPPADRRGIYVVMTFQWGRANEVRRHGDGLDVRIGEAEWKNPFGLAIPRAYVPGTSGSLMKYPGGTEQTADDLYE